MNAERDSACRMLDDDRQAHDETTTMPLLGNTDAESFADSNAITTITSAAAIVIDDSWLEAILDNLALASLSRRECVVLLERLETLEGQLDEAHADGSPRYQIVVGDQFDGPFNALEMRAPEAMTADNVIETIEVAAQHFLSQGHAAALKQLVFFISGNLEEVIADEDVDED